MKISKFEALKVLARHLVKKLVKGNEANMDITMIATSLSIMFNAHIAKFKSNGIMDDNERILIPKLKEELLKIFNMTPIMNFPVANSVVQITKEDILAFLKDLESNAEIEDVIYLPYN